MPPTSREDSAAKADVQPRAAWAHRRHGENGGSGIVLARRPYHVDPEINHGIPELIAAYGLTALTEDCLPIDLSPSARVRVNDQWVHHSRLYTAAEFVCGRDDLELIQLTRSAAVSTPSRLDDKSASFGAGRQAYTCLKIDEVNNLGAVRNPHPLARRRRWRRERGIHSR